MEGLTVPSPSVGYPRRLSLRWVLRRSGRAGRTLVYIPCLAALDGLGAERRGGPGGHLGHGYAEAAPVIAAAGRQGVFVSSRCDKMRRKWASGCEILYGNSFGELWLYTRSRADDSDSRL